MIRKEYIILTSYSFPPPLLLLLLFIPFPFFPSPPSLFSKYCKEKYGLTEDEIDYVWDQYKTIIKDKISKRES